MKRNILAIAFGLSIRDLRNQFDIKVSEISKEIGINESHYRVIESGATTMHISKSMEICVGFNSLLSEHNAKKFLSYEGIQKIILGISYVNSFYMKNNDVYSINHYEKAGIIENLKNFEPKLYILVREFEKADVFRLIDKNNEDLQKIFDQYSLDILVSNFITDYKNFGESPNELKDNFIKNFFDDIPSYYIHFLKNIKDDLKSLPVEIAFTELNKNWEFQNKDLFTGLLGIVRNPLQILSEKNLESYRYEYLWGEEFLSARFLFLEKDLGNYGVYKEDQQLKEIFINNLKKAYHEGLPENFYEKMNKITFKIVKENSQNDALKLLKNKTSDKVNRPKEYDATWVFSHLNLSNIGFQAKEERVEKDHYKLKHGISLNFKEAIEFTNDFNKVWNE